MDRFSIAFSNGSVVCAQGDYLICNDLSEGWQVYRVEDLLLVKRLVPVMNNLSMLIIEENLLDSITPAYFNEVQLLLTAFDPTFANELEILHAIHHQTLTERAKGLLRPAQNFTESACRVIAQP